MDNLSNLQISLDKNFIPCLKCSNKGEYCAVNSKKSIYCRSCFLKMVRHKFDFALGKNRVFSNAQPAEALLIYDPIKAGPSSALLLSLFCQSVSENNPRRHRVIPSVLVLLSGIPSNFHELKTNIEIYLKEFNQEWKFYFIHVAAILEENFAFENISNNIFGINKIKDYENLLESIGSMSLKLEVKNLLETHLIYQVAKKIPCEKVILSDNSEFLANSSLTALCFGRGSIISNLTDVVDSRFEGIQIVRPLRNVCDQEIELFHTIQGSQNLYPTPAPKLDHNNSIFGNGIQPLCSNYLNSLQNNGFPSTIETILSISSKVNSKEEISTKCQICLNEYSTNNIKSAENCCIPCKNLFVELNPDISEKIFNVIR